MSDHRDAGHYWVKMIPEADWRPMTWHRNKTEGWGLWVGTSVGWVPHEVGPRIPDHDEAARAKAEPPSYAADFIAGIRKAADLLEDNERNADPRCGPACLDPIAGLRAYANKLKAESQPSQGAMEIARTLFRDTIAFSGSGHRDLAVTRVAAALERYRREALEQAATVADETSHLDACQPTDRITRASRMGSIGAAIRKLV